MKCLLTLAFLLLLPFLAEAQSTWYVPDDYPAIQDAIDNAANGDTIIVRAGTYMENINYLGKTFTLKSESGPVDTVINGGQAESVVRFISGEGNDTVLDGFTLTNGWGYDGGGVFCENSAPTILNNIIVLNQANYGGGISILDSNEIDITGNIIENNYAWLSGGGIGCYTTLFLNLHNNIVSNNEAQSQIGGIEIQAADCSMTNNIVANNLASLSNGGGIAAIFWSNIYGVNNTIVGNSAGFQGGGVSADYESTVTLVNSILWDNTAVYAPGLFVTNGSTVDISYSDVEGGTGSAYVDGTSTLIWGTGMIELDPLFAAISDGDYHLTWSSPCRDTGYNFPRSLPPEDFEGDPRIAWDGTADMGVDEFYTHLYITGDITPGGEIQGKVVGLPSTSPVGLFIGSGLREPPAPTAYGDFYLLPPRILISLIPIPAQGILVIPTRIPNTPAGPYDVPMQTLVGLNSDSLTNLFVLQVR